jgi:hypothetical protein
MTRTIFQEVADWAAARTALRAKLITAMTTSDFQHVPANRYGTLPAGGYGYPVTVDLEAVILGQYQDLEHTTATANDAIGNYVQLNTMESFRRAYLSEKQTKRDFLAHYNWQLPMENKQDGLMLQQFAGVAKVLPL